MFFRAIQVSRKPLRCLGTLAVAFALLAPQTWAEVIRVPAHEVSPTQFGVGGGAVSEMMSHWAEQSRDYPGGLAAYLREKVLSRNFPGLEAPSLHSASALVRSPYIEDGHHRASAMARLLTDNYDDLPARVRQVISAQEQLRLRADPSLHLPVDIIRKIPTREDLVRYFVRSGSGLTEERIRADPAVRAAIRAVQTNQESPADLAVLLRAYRNLAPTLPTLRDDPIRSAVGGAFFQVRLNSDHLVNYTEFYVGERIRERLNQAGIIITRQNATTQEIADRVVPEIFNDPEIVAFLRRSVRPGHEAEAEKTISAAIDRFRELFPPSPRPTRPADFPRERQNCPQLFQGVPAISP